MRPHPYLRAYMAGIVVPTLFLLVVVAVDAYHKYYFEVSNQFVIPLASRPLDRALLFPINWEEPFGLVMIEAMATGTPVIGYRFGAVPEVVDEGVTGFVVDGPEAAIAAVGKIGTLDRAGVRKRFEERFTDTRMAASYLEIYRERLRAAAL